MPYLRFLLLGVTVAALAVGLAYVQSHRSAEEELNAYIAELDRTDPGWRLEDILAARKPPPDNENAALEICKLTPIMPRLRMAGTASRLDEDSFTKLEPGTRLTEEELLTLSEHVEKLKEPLAVVRKLNALREGQFPIRYIPNTMMIMLPDTQESGTACDLLWYDALTELDRGNLKGALTNVHGMLTAGTANGDEPILLSQLIRMGMRRKAIRALEYIMATGVSNEVTLKGLQDRLQAEASVKSLEVMARGQRAVNHEFFAALASGDASCWATANQFMERERKPSDYMQVAGYWTSKSALQDHLTVLRRSTQFLEATRKPAREMLELTRALDAEGPKQPLMTRALFSYGHERLALMHLRCQAETRAAIVALAAERFRLKHGRWPERLEDLIPQYLEAVPRDPFNDAPLRYVRTERGVTIYSTGINGQDHQGKILRWDHLVQGTSKDANVGFELFDRK
jgi:hypothetical protein